MLESIVESCMYKGDVIVTGDLNAHFASSCQYVRGWGRATKNGEKIESLCVRQGLVPVDITSLATGPKYTFLNDQGHQSYIDHVLIPNHQLTCVQSCEVLEDVLNTSDHLALLLSSQLPEPLTTPENSPVIQQAKVAWHKCTPDLCQTAYAKPLDCEIDKLLEQMEGISMTKKSLSEKFSQLIKLSLLVYRQLSFKSTLNL